jgi:hypothetical protein
LKLYFNIYDDRSGAPMLNIDAESAEITLLNTSLHHQGRAEKSLTSRFMSPWCSIPAAV